MLILLLHTLSTLSLLGLIWFVQCVHYPLFRFVDNSIFRDFARIHQRRTSLVVVPLMLTEAFTAIALVLSPPVGTRMAAGLGLILLIVIWLSTAVLQVPQHRLLLTGYSNAAALRLVRSNWIRTLAWSGRSLIALLLVAAEIAS